MKPGLIVLTLLAAGCASEDGLRTHGVPSDPAQLAATRSFSAAATGDAAWPRAAWWKNFGDPQLDALIAEAIDGSPQVDLARTRVERALALAKIAGAAQDIQVSFAADATRQRLSENGLVPPPFGGRWIWQNQASLNFSYEFDFWGRHGAETAAALGQARAAEAEAQAARLVLITAVARAYVQYARAFDQRDLAQAALDIRERQLALVRQRVAAGLDSRVELKQAEGAVPEARRDLIQAESAIELARYQIAALLGKGPDRGLDLTPPKLAADTAPSLPSVLPADLLGRRPDIVASRWRVEAAAREIDAARAQFLPNINLAAFAGLQAISWSKLTESGSRTLAAGPALRLPLFDGGRLRGNLAARNAEYDAAVAQYNQALATALYEVAEPVTALSSLRRQDAEVAAALAATREANDLALTRYRAGLANYLGVLAAQTQLLAQRTLALELRTRRLEAAIALAQALGGDFSGER